MTRRLHWWLTEHGPRAQYRNLRAFWQRGQRGWADRDTWGLDHYLARVLSESVAHLRWHTHGHPCELTPEQWDDILTEMSDRFARYDWDGYMPDPDALKGRPQDDIRAAYKAGDDAWVANKDAAFALLSQWIGDLWD